MRLNAGRAWCPLPLSDVAGAGPRTRFAIGFGHSHLTALQEAYPAWRAAGGPLRTDFIQLLGPRYQFTDVHASSVHGLIADTVRREAAERMSVAGSRDPFVFTCFSGNEHHIHSMIRNPRPFDFVLPGEEGLPLDPEAELLPYPAVEKLVWSMLRYGFRTLTAIVEALPYPIVALASPPPIRENAYLATPANGFWPQIQRHGLSNPFLRYKFWVLQTRFTAEAYGMMGVRMIYPPADTVDAEGFLREEAWGEDGTHGSAWYGAKLLSQAAGLAMTGG